MTRNLHTLLYTPRNNNLLWCWALTVQGVRSLPVKFLYFGALPGPRKQSLCIWFFEFLPRFGVSMSAIILVICHKKSGKIIPLVCDNVSVESEGLRFASLCFDLQKKIFFNFFWKNYFRKIFLGKKFFFPKSEGPKTCFWRCWFKKIFKKDFFFES